MSLQHLFAQIRILRQKYEEIAAAKKETFNVFRILGLESDEVRLHSRFVAELLDPKGSHLMGSHFFDLWLQQVLPDFEFSRKGLKIEVEKTIPSGRRLDILISNDENQCIIIENKIYADDQDRQLSDYYQYGKSYREFRLLYLSLFGNSPSDSSAKGLTENQDYVCISYDNDISIWLTQCQKESFDYPIIRETLKQYQAVLSLLTNKKHDSNYMQELSRLLAADQNYLSVYDINEAFKQLKINALAAVFEELEAALKAQGLEVEIQLKGKSIKEAARLFYSEHSKIKWGQFFIKTQNAEFSIGFELNQTLYIILINSDLQFLTEAQRLKASELAGIKWLREGKGFYTRPDIAHSELNFLNPSAEHLKIYLEPQARAAWVQAYAAEVKSMAERLGILPAADQIQELPTTPKDLPATYTDQFGIEFILVEGGSFEMGSNEKDNEKPIHTVRLDSFYIGKYPVTQEQWEKIMPINPSNFAGAKHPVESVSWYNTQFFIEEINKATGKTYRLPTEAEWEYAARGGKKFMGFPYAGCHQAKLGDYAWYDVNSNKSTQPVGTKKPNELGIYDMSGNVWEWCADGYAPSYYANSPVDNPCCNLENNQYRVMRGGSWRYSVDYCRVGYRDYFPPKFAREDYGFRLVLVP